MASVSSVFYWYRTKTYPVIRYRWHGLHHLQLAAPTTPLDHIPICKLQRCSAWFIAEKRTLFPCFSPCITWIFLFPCVLPITRILWSPLKNPCVV